MECRDGSCHGPDVTPAIIDIGPLARSAHRVFTANQILFVLGALFAVTFAGDLVTGDTQDYALDSANNVFRVLFFTSLLIYVAVAAVADYQAWYWRACAAASLVMLACMLYTAVFLIADDDDRLTTGLAAIVVFGLPVLWFYRQWSFCRRLLTARLAPFDRRLADVLADVPPIWAAQKAAGHGSTINGRLGAVLATIAWTAIAATAIAFFIGAMPLGDGHPVNDAAVTVLVIGLFTLPLWGGLLAIGRRLAQPDAGRLLAADERAPVLLLRSFQDDHARISTTNLFSRLLYFGFLRKMRLESAIADELNRIGPFIAVGRPGEKLPSLGAARAYLDDDAWQAQVLQWIHDARLIVIVGGTSHWVQWEMQQVGAQARLRQLVLLLPPKYGAEDRDVHHERWQRVVAGFVDTPWGPTLQQLDSRNLIALVGRADGGVLAFTSPHPTQADYEMVVRLAAYAQLSR